MFLLDLPVIIDHLLYETTFGRQQGWSLIAGTTVYIGIVTDGAFGPKLKCQCAYCWRWIISHYNDGAPQSPSKKKPMLQS